MNGRPALLLIPLVVAAAVYAPSLRYEFTNWDDPAYVVSNREVASLDLDSLGHVFDPRNRVVSEWTPIVTLTHQIEHALLGGGPAVAHAGNVLLHLVCIALVWKLGVASGGSLAIVLPAALLFALHPVQVESVAWVSGRKTLLATAFSMGALLLLGFGPPRTGRFAAGFVLFLLALGSKATAVVVPLWVGAAALLMDRERLRPLLPWIAAGLLVALGRGLMTLEMQSAAAREAREAGLIARLEITGPVLLTYARQMLWPSGLCAHYSWSPTATYALGAWGAIGAIVGLFTGIARRDRRLAFFGALAAIALLPTLNVLPAPHPQADRYLYAAMPGIALAIPILLARAPRVGPLTAAAIACALALALTPVTRLRMGTWRDATTLWTDTVACDPGFATGWSNLGLAEIEAGRPGEAERHLRRALEVDAAYLPAYANLGELYARTGRREEGERVLRAGLERGPHPDVLNNLAWLLLEDDPREAERLASLATHGDSRHAAAWDTLGVARLRLGDPEGARTALERGVTLRPALAELRYHLAEALMALGDSDGARMQARQALALLGSREPQWTDAARSMAR